MKKRYDIGFLGLQMFYPLCVLCGYLTGREFVLHSEWAYLIGAVALSVWLMGKIREGGETKWATPALAASLVHGIVLIFVLQWWMAGIAAVAVSVAGWMVFEMAPKSGWKVFCHVLSFLLALLLLLTAPLWLFVAAMVHREVVQKVVSPGGGYTAIVTSVDQGALGGDTIIEVRDERKSVNLLVGSFVSSREVYRGGWGEWETMALFWEKEGILSINGTAVSVSGEDVEILTEIAVELGTTILNGELVEYADTHGGFHGDGETFAKIRCEVEIPDSGFWHSLPLPEELTRQSAIPAVENGGYFFHDRHSESADPADSGALWERASVNYTLAV